MQTPVTHKQALQIVETVLKGGEIASFTYVLAAHVLHRMQQADTRQIMVSAEDLYGKVLVDGKNRFIAGDVRVAIHLGQGRLVGAQLVSPLYISALQALHVLGILQNDVQESRLGGEGETPGHFTMLPEVHPGVHWTEKSPVVYRLSSLSVDDLVGNIFGMLSAFDSPNIELSAVANA